MKTTPRALTLATAAATLALTGCSAQTGVGPGRASTPVRTPGQTVTPSRTATPDPTTTGEAVSPLARIPGDVRNRYLDETAHTPGTDLLPRVLVLDAGSPTRHLAVTKRVLPGCDGGTHAHLEVDQDVLDFGWTLRRLPNGYLVARQLTVYPTVAAARSFLTTADQAPIGCPSGTLDGHAIGSSSRTDLGPDRFFGVKDNHDGTLFSESQFGTRRQVSTSIDVVTREANVVILTRVTNPDHDGSEVITNKPEEPEFVKVVRAEGSRSAAILDAFE
jgi:hypothetical protein